MRISLISDVHLEFGHCNVANNDNAQVLVLAGDICVAADFDKESKISARYHEFFEMVSKQFRHVLYVLGNHEHYRGDFSTTVDIIRTNLSKYPNIKVLDKESVIIDDVVFVGGTLWTNFNNDDPIAIYHAKRNMNDYRVISNSNNLVSYKIIDYAAMGTTPDLYHSTRLLDEKDPPIMKFANRPGNFSPDDSIEDHNAYISIIDAVCSNYSDKKVVVIGHHAPTSMSIDNNYIGDPLNPAYYSDLSKFILDRPNIAYWMHGHVHCPFNYSIGDTTIVCNPRGYVGYEVATEDSNYLTVEV